MNRIFIQSQVFILLFLGITIVHAQGVMDFDGVDDNITVANASSYIANGPMSLSFWVYPTNPNAGWPDFDGFVGFRNDLSADFYLLQLNSTNVEARFRNSSGTAYDIVFSGMNLNTWNHFVFTYNNSTLTLYHNGNNVGSRAATGSITSTSSNLNIGWLPFGGNNFYTDGQMDEVALWDISLNQSQVSQLYNSCSFDTSATGLVLAYLFDEGTAGGNNTGISSLMDSKGNTNGALNNFSLTGNGSNFIVDTKPSTSSTTSLLVSECDSYTSPSGKYIWTTTGMYLDTINNATGCDSLFSIDLSISTSSSANVALADCDSVISPSGLYTWTSQGVYQDTISNMAGCDSVMIVKVTITGPSPVSISESNCEPYTSPSGRYIWDSTGTYHDTLISAAGCDSLMEIQLTILEEDTSVTQVSNVELMANQSGSVYQWIDCQSGQPIQGATSQSFTATQNGSYAVIITDQCTDTSSCYSITSVGILGKNRIDLRLYPNPANDILKLDLGKSYPSVQVRIYNLFGQVLLEREYGDLNTTELDIQDFAPGLYTIGIETEESQGIVKFVKD